MPAQAQEAVLYSFGGGNGSGVAPTAGLTNVNGVLFGTTEGGGANNCSAGSGLGCGNVFKITTSGTARILYRFANPSVGERPYAGLTDVNGVLYGTTEDGGAKGNNGTIFKTTTSGSESLLYSFAGGSDGQSPEAGLTNVDGVLYGTTAGGGANARGTVFKITTSGDESVLYSFAGGTDSASPYAGLTNVAGVLYGTTFHGGINCSAGTGLGCGTVFKITTSGAESLLYSFAGGSDGASPEAKLTNVNGVLFGTTYDGGANGRGTVFRITMSGAESVLYSFAGGSDGANPVSGLTNVDGVLYGTTYSGGTEGHGTVYSITTAGAESVVHSFGSGSDGAAPNASLVSVNGVFYGTTVGGGANNRGTVFSLSL